LPESALLADLEHDVAAGRQVGAFVSTHRTPLLAGGPASTLREPGVLARFNSAWFVHPERAMEAYHKRALVPLAEDWPSMLGEAPSDLTGLHAGHDATVFALGDDAFGVLICFEITDAASARLLVRNGAHFIVNPTNDAWFVPAPDAPHLPWAAVRAVETGLPVVRSANAGVSGVYDRFGRAVATSQPHEAPAVLEASLPPAVPTLYARIGDVFLLGCLGLVLGGVVGAWRRGRAARPT
jgi:apolipoprotein N-acyltransferase